MVQKKSFIPAILGIIILMFIIAGLSKLYLMQIEPTKIITVSEVSTAIPIEETIKQQNYGYPVRLQIDTIGIDALVQYVGLTKSGDLASPNNITDAGWYRLGTRPGNPGSAVLDGHFNGPKGQPGVFSRLNKLKKGDVIVTTDNLGTRVEFSVTELRTYTYNEQPEEVFNSSDNGAHLNLITCSGTWNAEQKIYSERTVVFSRAVSL